MATPEKRPDWIMTLVSIVIGISLSCAVGYFGFQRSTDTRISVLENQMKTQTEELTRQRDFVASTIEPRLRGIENQLSGTNAQLAAIRLLLEKR